MFQEFYGFTSLPFSRTLATKDLFPTASQKELGARLTYLVRERSVGLITGDIGSGKSTAVRAFAANLDFNRYLVLYLANPTTGMTGLYRDLLLQLGVEPPFGQPRLVARRCLGRSPPPDPADAREASLVVQRQDGQPIVGHTGLGRPSGSAPHLALNRARSVQSTPRRALSPRPT